MSMQDSNRQLSKSCSIIDNSNNNNKEHKFYNSLDENTDKSKYNLFAIDTNQNNKSSSSNCDKNNSKVSKFKGYFKSCVRSLSGDKNIASDNSTTTSEADKNNDSNLRRGNIGGGQVYDKVHGQTITTFQKELNHELNVDSGYAWVILAVMFVINASTFGTARAYGLIFEKLARDSDQSRGEAALPFTIMGAIENMGGPLTGYLLAKTRSWRLIVCLGCCLITLSHLLTAFCDTLLGQTLTMGLMCGTGLSFVTISSFQINNAYFKVYRSRAFGLGLTGAVFGTFYISPLCQYVLNNYSINACYLMLSLVLFPNVPLSLLLKPKKPIADAQPPAEHISTISGQLEQVAAEQAANKVSIWKSIKLVLKNPAFHLIWPTQLLFCWFNFVFGMIIVDFGRDRGMKCGQVEQLIPTWALGQLVGRTVLGSLVDLKMFSYECFTVICFASIGLSTWTLNVVRIDDHYEHILISVLVFVLSMFISNLYILFNGLVVRYMDDSFTALTIGISSFAGSFFLLPRAQIIGYYRDTTGNYDAMLTMFTYVSLAAALVWLIIPCLCSRLSPTYWRTASQTIKLSTPSMATNMSISGSVSTPSTSNTSLNLSQQDGSSPRPERKVLCTIPSVG